MNVNYPLQLGLLRVSDEPNNNVLMSRAGSEPVYVGSPISLVDSVELANVQLLQQDDNTLYVPSGQRSSQDQGLFVSDSSSGSPHSEVRSLSPLNMSIENIIPHVDSPSVTPVILVGNANNNDAAAELSIRHVQDIANYADVISRTAVAVSSTKHGSVCLVDPKL